MNSISSLEVFNGVACDFFVYVSIFIILCITLTLDWDSGDFCRENSFTVRNLYVRNLIDTAFNDNIVSYRCTVCILFLSLLYLVFVLILQIIMIVRFGRQPEIDIRIVR